MIPIINFGNVRSLKPYNRNCFISIKLLTFEQQQIINELSQAYSKYFDKYRKNYFIKLKVMRKNSILMLNMCKQYMEKLQKSKNELIVQINAWVDMPQTIIKEKMFYLDHRTLELDEQINTFQDKISNYNCELISLVYYPLIHAIFKWLKFDPTTSIDIILMNLYYFAEIFIPPAYSFFTGDVKELSKFRLIQEISFHPILLEIERHYVSKYPSWLLKDITYKFFIAIEKKKNLLC